MPSRLPAISPDEMTTAQRALFEAITGGARGQKSDPSEFLNEEGALRGPFNALLRTPDLGQAVQRVGEQVRFATTIPDDLREIAILTCARHWRSNYEWFAHARIARAEGVPETEIDRILNGDAPEAPDAALIFTFVRELNEHARVDDARYEEVQQLLGDQGVTELTILSGYYALIAQLLNVFQVPVPSGETAPFPD